jgi:hypothetical protein
MRVLEFKALLAERGGRRWGLEFTCVMATANGERGAPGKALLEFICSMAGRRGRTLRMEFRVRVATAMG